MEFEINSHTLNTKKDKAYIPVVVCRRIICLWTKQPFFLTFFPHTSLENNVQSFLICFCNCYLWMTDDSTEKEKLTLFKSPSERPLCQGSISWVSFIVCVFLFNQNIPKYVKQNLNAPCWLQQWLNNIICPTAENTGSGQLDSQLLYWILLVFRLQKNPYNIPNHCCSIVLCCPSLFQYTWTMLKMVKIRCISRALFLRYCMA